jgi:hypothetical protein
VCICVFVYIKILLCVNIGLTAKIEENISIKIIQIGCSEVIGGIYKTTTYDGRPHRFPHNNFSSVYQIFTKLGHVIIGFKCLNHIHVGVSLIRDKKRQEDINSDKN